VTPFFCENVSFKLDLFKTANNGALKVIFYLLFGFLGLILIFFAGAFWMADPLNLRAPKDQELIAVFHTHREAFEKLQQMVTEDARHGWYFNSTDFVGRKIEESRWQKYNQLVSEIRPGLKVGTDYDGGMRFGFAGGGLLAIGPGWAKGIEYVPGDNKKAGIIATNLDKAGTLPANIYTRQIEPKWFLFYQRDD
jgi:hypothetical protein